MLSRLTTAVAVLMGAMFFFSAEALAASGGTVDFTSHAIGWAALCVFVLAYFFVIIEETIHLKKSKPVILAAGLIWILVSIAYRELESADTASILRHTMLEFAEMALFLLSAMAYIGTLEERGVFSALRARLVSSGWSLRTIFWITGVIAFFLSPVADNLTTALVMGAVVLAVGVGNPVFVSVSCINIVVAANAGGAFSPFGDITTLMVWQKGLVAFTEFFELFIPSLVSWLIPAFCMSFAVPKVQPQKLGEKAEIKQGGIFVIFLFLATICMTVALHQAFHLPPFLGMMTGLGFLSIFGYFVRNRELKKWVQPEKIPGYKPVHKPFDVFISIKRVEWDTLLFFYGVILCVGGLGALGYLQVVSNFFYIDLGPTVANIMVGGLSAIVDNIPVMFAVLTMNPEMSHGQWLLVTLTAGIGGSLLSIGSAAGVALMGQARGVYTFFSHLKWTWAVALGYAAGVWVHIVLNGV